MKKYVTNYTNQIVATINILNDVRNNSESEKMELRNELRRTNASIAELRDQLRNCSQDLDQVEQEYDNCVCAAGELNTAVGELNMEELNYVEEQGNQVLPC